MGNPRKDELEITQQTIRFLEASLRASADGIVITDAAQKIVVVNEAFCGFFDQRYRDVIETSLLGWLEQLDGDGPRRWCELEQRMRDGSVCRDVEFRRTTDDGVRHFSVNASLIAQVAGEEHGLIISSWRDVTEHRQAEEALRESERKFRAIFDHTFQFIGLMRPDGVLTEANRAALDFAGIEESEVLGKPFWDTPWWTHSSALQDRLRDAVKRAAAGDFVRLEATHPATDGTMHSIDFSLKPVMDESGNVVLLIPEGRDITERKRAEQEREILLHALGERVKELRCMYNVADSIQKRTTIEDILRDTVAHMPSAWHYPEVTRVRIRFEDEEYISECFEETEWRQSADIVVAGEVRGCIDVYSTEQQPDLVEGPFLQEERELIDSIAYALSAGFERKRAEQELSRHREQLEELVKERTVELRQEIVERERAEQDLRKERDFSAALLQSSPTFFVAISAEGRTLMMNETMLTSLGYAEDEVVGTKYLETFVPEYDRALLAKVFARLVQSNEATLNENRVLTKDGRELLVEWHGRPIFKENGEFDFFFGVGIDITERRQAEKERLALEAQIQQAQKLESLGVLAGGIAHDFNNLLVSVLGNASLALDKLPQESREWNLVKGIERSACRAADLTKQMLAYSGRGQFVIGPIDLSKLVEEMTHLLRASISKKVMLKLDFPEDLPAVEADATQVRQVVMNLITNASEAIDDQSGLLTVRTGIMEADRAYLSEVHLDDDLPAGSYVFIEVTDTGCGMEEAVRAKIFDPFFTTKFTGRGLGLAAVLGIVRGHRGAIRIQSEVGQGTAIRVLFPASDRTIVPALVAEGAPSEKLRGTGTVLVVDDEEDVRCVARRMLEESGFTVLTANDGREALVVFRERRDAIDAVVLDLTMPFLSGEEVFREMRRMRADARVILSSGYNQQEAIDRFAGKGLAGFLQKPYRSDTLLETLHEIMNA